MSNRLMTAAVVATSILAFAEERETREIEEIVVTATHRETNLMETPQAISAVSGQQVEGLGVTDMQGLVRLSRIGLAESPANTSVATIPSICVSVRKYSGRLTTASRHLRERIETQPSGVTSTRMDSIVAIIGQLGRLLDVDA